MTKEEALNKVRQMSLPKETMEILQALAPELRESEDERIRKWIIDFAKGQIDGYMLVDDDESHEIAEIWKEAIAYLEKQKERGPLTKEEEYELHRIIEFLEDETCPSEWISLLHDIYCLPYEKQKEQNECPEFCSGHCVGCEQKEQKPTEVKDPFSNANFVRGYESGYADAKREQKPIQTSEEKEYIRTLKSLISDFIRDKQPADVAFYQKIYDWLEERHIEQKTIKVLYIPKFRTGELVRSSKNPRLTYKILSVGSMNELGNPEYEVEIFTDGKPDEPRNLKHIEIEKMDSWGELVKQKSAGEQFPPLEGLDAIKAKWFKNGFDEGVESVKPAEWSEEDIKKIRSEEYTKGFNDAAFGGKLKEWSVEDEDRIRQIERISQQAGCTQKLQEEIHDWLKSLRPSWKPSEEQMSMLLAVIRDPNNAGSESCSLALKSIYEQLKKLM